MLKLIRIPSPDKWVSPVVGRANRCGNNRRFITLLFQIFTKPLNICSDFHLDKHFFGLVRGFFVGHSVTLLMNQRNVYAIF